MMPHTEVSLKGPKIGTQESRPRRISAAAGCSTHVVPYSEYRDLNRNSANHVICRNSVRCALTTAIFSYFVNSVCSALNEMRNAYKPLTRSGKRPTRLVSGPNMRHNRLSNFRHFVRRPACPSLIDTRPFFVDVWFSGDSLFGKAIAPTWIRDLWAAGLDTVGRFISSPPAHAQRSFICEASGDFSIGIYCLPL